MRIRYENRSPEEIISLQNILICQQKMEILKCKNFMRREYSRKEIERIFKISFKFHTRKAIVDKMIKQRIDQERTIKKQHTQIKNLTETLKLKRCHLNKVLTSLKERGIQL